MVLTDGIFRTFLRQSRLPSLLRTNLLTTVRLSKTLLQLHTESILPPNCVSLVSTIASNASPIHGGTGVWRFQTGAMQIGVALISLRLGCVFRKMLEMLYFHSNPQNASADRSRRRLGGTRILLPVANSARFYLVNKAHQNLSIYSFFAIGSGRPSVACTLADTDLDLFAFTVHRSLESGGHHGNPSSPTLLHLHLFSAATVPRLLTASGLSRLIFPIPRRGLLESSSHSSCLPNQAAGQDAEF